MEINENWYKPTVFWSWNNVITPNEAYLQVKDFAQKGFGGVFIHARNVRIPYLQDEWFQCFDASIDSAIDNGIYIWIYDENGWPSGFAGGVVNNRGKKYQQKKLRKNVKGGDVLCSHNGDIFSVVYEPNYVDLLDPDVTSLFLSTVHEKYKKRYKKHFGNVIKGVFTDEPQLDNEGYPYSPIMDSLFIERYGINLKKNIWKLFTESHEHAEFKIRYFNLIGELFRTNYTEKIELWCRENDLIFTGHFPCEDGLCSQPSVTGGVESHYKIMSMPGIDFLGKRYASSVLLKQISSVKNIYRKAFVLTESFAGVGNTVKFNDFIRLYAYQAAFGINFLCMHLSAYSIEGDGKRDYPPAISYQQPWWNKVNHLCNEIKRMNHFISDGVVKPKILLFAPLESVSICALFDEKQADISANYRQTIEYLRDIGVEFDIFDDTFYEDVSIVNDKIGINGRVYDVAMLPKSVSISKKTYDVLSLFAKNNNLIVLGDYPKMIGGLKYKFDLKNEFVINRYETVYMKIKDRGLLNDVELVSHGNFGVRDIILRVSYTVTGINIFLFNKNENASNNFFLAVNGDGSLINVTDEKNQYSLMGNYIRKRKYFNITIHNGEYQMLKFIKGDEIDKQSTVVEEKKYKLTNPIFEGEDFFVIDKAFYDGDGFLKLMPVDEIRDVAKLRNKTTIKYNFITDVTDNIMMIAEVLDGELFVNGNKIRKTKQWKIDKLLPVYDLNGVLKKGNNVIEYICYNKHVIDKKTDEFESVANSEQQCILVENIILFGKFSVYTINNVENSYNGYYIVKSKKNEFPFIIKEKTIEKEEFFSRRKTIYNKKIDFDTGKYGIGVIGMTAPIVSIYIDNSLVGHIIKETEPLCFYIDKGQHDVKLVLEATNNNIFGPLHSCETDNVFVGRSSFVGEKDLFDYFDVNKNKEDFNDYVFYSNKLLCLITYKYE